MLFRSTPSIHTPGASLFGLHGSSVLRVFGRLFGVSSMYVQLRSRLGPQIWRLYGIIFSSSFLSVMLPYPAPRGPLFSFFPGKRFSLSRSLGSPVWLLRLLPPPNLWDRLYLVGRQLGEKKDPGHFSHSIFPKRPPLPQLLIRKRISSVAFSLCTCCTVLGFGLLSLGQKICKEKLRKLTTIFVLLKVFLFLLNSTSAIHFSESLCSCFMSPVRVFSYNQRES